MNLESSFLGAQIPSFKWIDVIALAIISISIFTSLILILKGSLRPHNIKLIGLAFLFFNLFALVSLALLSGWLVYFPWVLRIFTPLYFLIGPFIFFFIRGAIFEKDFSLKVDFWHLIPAFLQFIDLVPFYFLDLESKRLLALALVEKPNLIMTTASGIIPIVYWYIFRSVLLLTYSISIIIIIIKNQKLIRSKVNGFALNSFLSTISIIFLVLALMSRVNILLVSEWYLGSIGSDTLNAIRKPTLELASLMLLLGVNFLFFLRPWNIFDPAIYQNSPREKQNKSVGDTDDGLLEKEIELNERFRLGMLNDKWFKIKGFNLDHCCQLLGCERHVFSPVIRKVYKKRFTDVVNEYRLEYVEAEIKAGKLKNITLEGLSEEAGFNSRITFYKVFIKHKGINPSTFVTTFNQTLSGRA